MGCGVKDKVSTRRGVPIGTVFVDMPLYDIRTECPKCGSSSLSLEFIPTDKEYVSGGANRYEERSTLCGCDRAEELLKVECNSCSFNFAMRTLDNYLDVELDS